MSEKRGYPNPNYTEDDVTTEEEAILEEVGLVTLPVDHFEMLVSKAAALDILKSDLERRNDVNDDIVRAVTGALTNHELEKLAKDKETYWGYYWKEKEKTESQALKIANLERANNELKELLRQNHIGPYEDAADEEEEKKDE